MQELASLMNALFWGQCDKLLGQGFVKERFSSSLRKFYGRYGDIIKYNMKPHLLNFTCESGR